MLVNYPDSSGQTANTTHVDPPGTNRTATRLRQQQHPMEIGKNFMKVSATPICGSKIACSTPRLQPTVTQGKRKEFSRGQQEEPGSASVVPLARQHSRVAECN